tara:strand:+ start:3557 stop:5578 length:2022 start_codon:yes stop_codon:yes gene_type:complete
MNSKINFILKYFGKIKKKFDKFLADKFKGGMDENGKLAWIDSRNIKKLLIVGVASFIILLMMVKMINQRSSLTGGAENYKQEQEENLGLSTYEKKDGINLSEDNLDLLNVSSDDYARDYSDSGINVTGDSLDFNTCLELLNKVKKGDTLTPEEEQDMKDCIAQNKIDLSDEERRIVEQLLDGDLTEAERQLLTDFLNGDLSADEMELARALMSGDPERVAKAKAAIALRESNPAAYNALMKDLLGQELTDAERALIAQALQQTGNDNQNVEVVSEQEQLNNLLDDIIKREKEIQDLETEVAEKQLRASNALAKAARGEKLTPEETQLIKDFESAKSRLDALKAKQEEDRIAFDERRNKMLQSLLEMDKTLTRVLPSGIRGDFSEINCEEIKPLAYKPIKKKVKYVRKNKYYDADGNPISPDQLRLIRLMKKEKAEEEEKVASLKDPTNDSFFDDMGKSPSIGGTGGAGSSSDSFSADKLVFYEENADSEFKLTPDMPIPAMIMSEIKVSDKENKKRVRIKVLTDIINPRTGEVYIGKNSLAIAETGSFSTETGVMDLAVSKIYYGNREISISATIGSGDGSYGLKGQVHSSDGKYLAGLFITSFASGALSALSQQYIQPFLDSSSFQEQMQGAALQGGSEVANRIAEDYATKLQNAGNIFYAPKGLPILIYPN